MEGAAGNLAAEAPHNDFDKYVAETKENWNRQLGKIEVRGICDLDDKVNFYTALYRTMIAPTVFSDVDGSYYGPDKKIHKADGWVNYGTFLYGILIVPPIRFLLIPSLSAPMT